MYRIKDADGNILTQVETPRYVKKKPSTGAWIQTNAYEAECVAIDCKRYSIAGKELVEDAPQVVTIEHVDSALESLKQNKTLDKNSYDIELLAYAIDKMAEEVIEVINNKL